MQVMTRPFRSSWFLMTPIVSLWQGWQSWSNTSDLLDLMHIFMNFYKEYRMILNSFILMILCSAIAGIALLGLVLLWVKHRDRQRFKRRVQELAVFTPPISDDLEIEHW